MFHKNSYLVDVNYHIHNPTATPWEGNLYGQLRQEHQKDNAYSFLNVQMYQGGAMYLPEKHYKKVSFSDMKKQNVNEGSRRWLGRDGGALFFKCVSAAQRRLVTILPELIKAISTILAQRDLDRACQ